MSGKIGGKNIGFKFITFLFHMFNKMYFQKKLEAQFTHNTKNTKIPMIQFKSNRYIGTQLTVNPISYIKRPLVVNIFILSLMII